MAETREDLDLLLAIIHTSTTDINYKQTAVLLGLPDFPTLPAHGKA